MINVINRARIEHPKFTRLTRLVIINILTLLCDIAASLLLLFITIKSNHNDQEIVNILLSKQSLPLLQILPYFIIGSIVGLVVNFFLNYFFYFTGDKSQLDKKASKKFLIASSIAFIIYQIITLVAIGGLNIEKWTSKIIPLLLFLIVSSVLSSVFIKNKVSEVGDNSVITPKEKMTRKNFWFNIFFIISSMATILLCYNANSYNLFNNTVDHIVKYVYAILGGIVLLVIFFKFKRNLFSQINLKNKILEIILTFVFSICMFISLIMHSTLQRNIELTICSILSLFSIMVYSYAIIHLVVKKVKEFVFNLTSKERICALILTTVGIVFVVVLFLVTTAFSGIGNTYDVFLSYDTGSLLNHGAFVDLQFVENDSRHILMTLCMLPFTTIPFAISQLVSSIEIFALLVGIVQVFLMVYCCFKIVEFIKINNENIRILIVVLMMITSGIFINMITLEKFVFCLFYIVLCVDCIIKKSKYKWLSLVLATGIATTNIFLIIPVLLSEKKTIREYVSEVVWFIGLFLLVVLLSGQFNNLVFFIYSWSSVRRFATVGVEVGTINLFLQFFIFVASMIFSPSICFYQKSAIQADPSVNILFILGVIIFIASIIGFFVSEKNLYNKCCLFWQIFMFFLLVIIGWGGVRNEMFIYSAIFLL